MISRRRFITGFVIALTPLGATATAQEYKAQQAGKLYSIGVLTSAAGPSPTSVGSYPRVWGLGVPGGHEGDDHDSDQVIE
jgi:hypothetical protein